jgi:hypothetical protein
MPEDREVVFTIRVKPETVEVDGRIGAGADEADAVALCERLLDAVWDFSRATA